VLRDSEALVPTNAPPGSKVSSNWAKVRLKSSYQYDFGPWGTYRGIDVKKLVSYVVSISMNPWRSDRGERIESLTIGATSGRHLGSTRARLLQLTSRRHSCRLGIAGQPSDERRYRSDARVRRYLYVSPKKRRYWLEEKRFDSCGRMGQIRIHAQSARHVDLLIHQVEGSRAICIRARNREKQVGESGDTVSQNYLWRIQFGSDRWRFCVSIRLLLGSGSAGPLTECVDGLLRWSMGKMHVAEVLHRRPRW
jgi:hypothetical protein